MLAVKGSIRRHLGGMDGLVKLSSSIWQGNVRLAVTRTCFGHLISNPASSLTANTDWPSTPEPRPLRLVQMPMAGFSSFPP